jgi:hypothetical protein
LLVVVVVEVQVILRLVVAVVLVDCFLGQLLLLQLQYTQLQLALLELVEAALQSELMVLIRYLVLLLLLLGAVEAALMDMEAVFQAVQAVVQHGLLVIAEALERQVKVMLAVKTQLLEALKAAVAVEVQEQ